MTLAAWAIQGCDEDWLTNAALDQILAQHCAIHAITRSFNAYGGYPENSN